MTESQLHSKPARLDAIDLARGIALVAMAIYHLSWDLEFFGYLDPGTTGSGPLKWFARSIASSFLVLVGISLFLAHGNGVRRQPYVRRLAIVIAAAAVITIATYLFSPGAFVFFGILHHIALASVLGLAFLTLPPFVVLAGAVLILALPLMTAVEAFSHPALLWIGLSPVPPRTNDYVPLFPWFGMVLIGIAGANLAARSGVLERLSALNAGNRLPARVLRFLGRHSLATYLLHQPLLIASVYAFSLALPVERSLVEDNLDSCERICVQESDARFCTAYCGCAITRLDERGLLEPLSRGEIGPDSEPDIVTITRACAGEANNRDE